jgi:hypothetical protein
MKITLDSQQLNMLRSRIATLYGVDKNGVVNINGNDTIELVYGTSNIHVELLCPCTVMSKGECNIHIDILGTLLKHIKSSTDVTISTETNDLVVKAAMMGSIREPCSQSTLSKYKGASTKVLVDGLDVIKGLNSFRGKPARLIIKDDVASLYGMYGTSCVAKYQSPINRIKDNDDVINMVINPTIARLLPILGNDISLGIKDRTIKLSSSIGSISTSIESDQVYDFDVIDNILAYSSIASISVDTNTLKDVVNWHSYRSNAGHSLHLTTSKSSLSVNSKSLAEDSLIPSSALTGSLDITISMDNLSSTLDRLSLSTLSTLEQKSLNLKDGSTYNVLVVRNEDSTVLGVINEQAT